LVFKRVIGAILFDLDGTLIDSLPGISAALNRALGASGWPSHPPAKVRTFIGDGSWWLARRALPAEAPDTAVAAVEASFKADYALSWPVGTVPFAGIPSLLSDLNSLGRPLAVLSNKPHDFTVEIVKRLFPAVAFAAVRGEIHGIARKPDPAAALAIARELALEPAKILFVGDSRVDAQTAHHAGMPAALVGWGYDDALASVTTAQHWCQDLTSLRTLLGS
jgi:phosphoglycolate phosphatase